MSDSTEPTRRPSPADMTPKASTSTTRPPSSCPEKTGDAAPTATPGSAAREQRPSTPRRKTGPKPYVLAGPQAFQAAIEGRKTATVVTAGIGAMIAERRQGMELRAAGRSTARVQCRVRQVKTIPHVGKVPATAENYLKLSLSDFTDYHQTWKSYQKSLRDMPCGAGTAAIVVFELAGELEGEWVSPDEKHAQRRAEQGAEWVQLTPATPITPSTPIHPDDVEELPRRLVEHGGPWSSDDERTAVAVLTEHGRCGAAMPRKVRGVVDRTVAQRVHDRLTASGLILDIPGLGEVFSPAMLAGLRVLPHADG